MNIIIYTVVTLILNFFIVKHIYSKYDYKYCKVSKITHCMSLIFSILNLGFILSLFLKNILTYECSPIVLTSLLLINFSISTIYFNILNMNEEKLITNTNKFLNVKFTY